MAAVIGRCSGFFACVKIYVIPKHTTDVTWNAFLAFSVVISAQDEDIANAVFMDSSKVLTPDCNGFTVSIVSSVCVSIRNWSHSSSNSWAVNWKIYGKVLIMSWTFKYWLFTITAINKFLLICSSVAISCTTNCCLATFFLAYGHFLCPISGQYMSYVS